jgi:hypothetical protein
MRSAVRVALLALAATALGACHKHGPAAKLASATIPGAGETQLAPGLWVERVADRNGVKVTRYCLDAASAGRLSYFGDQLNGRCTRRAMAQAADGSWHFSTDCDMGRWGKVATEGVIKGDFRSHYTIDVSTQTIGAAAPAIDGANRVLADRQRVGDCPSDMKPGDMILPDGSRSTVGALQAPA